MTNIAVSGFDLKIIGRIDIYKPLRSRDYIHSICSVVFFFTDVAHPECLAEWLSFDIMTAGQIL